MKHCPECWSTDVSKDKQRGGWTGDYICGSCGFNSAPDDFLSDSEIEAKKLSGEQPMVTGKK